MPLSLGRCVFTGTRVSIRYEAMLLITCSSGLCFRKAAYQQFVAEGECIHSVVITKHRGKWSSRRAGSAGLEGHVCEFTISSLAAWVLGAAPGPHREPGP